MDDKKLRKPENLKDETWNQHLHWMDVMDKQVKDNIARHEARVKEDQARSKALLEAHMRTLQDDKTKRSLFSFSNGVHPKQKK